MKRLAMLIVVSLLIAPIVKIPSAAGSAKPETGPSMENLMAAEDGLGKAFRENNADGIQSYLSDDWAVVVAFGNVDEGKDTFPSGIRSGHRILTTFDVTEPRARLNGDTGWITYKLHLAGKTGAKLFDVMERSTDIWIWKDGAWKCTLSHETLFPNKACFEPGAHCW